MPQLFTLPKAVPVSATGGLLAGAKLYFTKTATSTPQNVYQDIGLTVPHANPVAADANGVFSPIYLDASLPDYRVKLTTSADVLIYQLDDIPAGQDTAQSYRLVAVAPELIFQETDASANNGRWRIRTNAEKLTIDLGNDAESVWTNILTINRAGLVDFSTDVSVNSILIDGDSPTESDSFVAAITGYASALTPTIQWRRSGTSITLSCNSGSVGTSTTNALTMTGLPAAIQPMQSYNVITRLEDNGVSVVGIAAVGPSGTITFGNSILGGAFTPSGNKGLPGGWSLSYDIG